MVSSPARRSARRRTAAPKYTTDVFEVAGLEVGSSESEQLSPEEEEGAELSYDLGAGGRSSRRGARRGTRRRDDEEYEEEENKDAERKICATNRLIWELYIYILNRLGGRRRYNFCFGV